MLRRDLSVLSQVEIAYFAGLFVCDHIVALCNGGRDWYMDPAMLNFQTLCLDCNRKKTNKDMQILYYEKKRVQAVGVNGFSLLDFPFVEDFNE